jgi:hypothetical protein
MQSLNEALTELVEKKDRNTVANLLVEIDQVIEFTSSRVDKLLDMWVTVTADMKKNLTNAQSNRKLILSALHQLPL